MKIPETPAHRMIPLKAPLDFACPGCGRDLVLKSRIPIGGIYQRLLDEQEAVQVLEPWPCPGCGTLMVVKLAVVALAEPYKAPRPRLLPPPDPRQ